MATVNPVEISVFRGVKVYKWTNVTENDTFGVAVVPQFSDKTVQVTGTFGSATVLIAGSVDPAAATVFTLHKPDSNTQSYTSAGGAAIQEAITAVKPSHSGGSSESVTVWLLCTTARG